MSPRSKVKVTRSNSRSKSYQGHLNKAQEGVCFKVNSRSNFSNKVISRSKVNVMVISMSNPGTRSFQGQTSRLRSSQVNFFKVRRKDKVNSRSKVQVKVKVCEQGPGL